MKLERPRRLNPTLVVHQKVNNLHRNMHAPEPFPYNPVGKLTFESHGRGTKPWG